MTPEEETALRELVASVQRAQEINKACQGAGIELDGYTAGAFLYMAAKLAHLYGSNREDWLAACKWLWEKLEQAAGAP